MPEIVAALLKWDGAPLRHDQAAIDRLLVNDENLNGVWRWLMSLDDNEQRAAFYAQHFVIAALQAYGWVQQWRGWSAKERAAWLAEQKGAPGDAPPYALRIDRAWQSRKNTPQTVFLRTLRCHLDFPGLPAFAQLHGSHVQIAVIASALLNETVDSRHVSKLLSE